MLADPRYPGGTTRAVAAEARALHNAGLSAGFLPVLGAELRRAAVLHPDLARAVAEGALVPLDWTERRRARLAIVHHPRPFRHPPAEPLGLSAEQAVLVLHHPPFDGLGAPNYDLAAILAGLRQSLDCEVALAPVGPAVRAQLARLPEALAPALDEDWSNLLDFADWPLRGARTPSAEIVVGRHARPDPFKVPDSLEEALLAWPEREGVRVRLMGVPPDLLDRYGRIPATWELLPFGAEPVDQFLRSLDAFVHAHGRAWVEAFGYGPLEAIATGVPAILPPALAQTFGEAAHYATLGGIGEAIDRIAATPPAQRAARAREARALAEARFSVDAFLPRLDRVAPGWDQGGRRAGRPVPAAPRRPPRVVMATSNGVGLGHLTRLMAIAGRLPRGSTTGFFTLSQGYRLAVEAGYLTQYHPFHRLTRAPNDPWNRALAVEFGAFLDLLRPDVAVFDGNMPYAGLIEALSQRTWIRRAWVRRALWSHESRTADRRAPSFDLVIEPGEVSGHLDRVGLAVRASAVRVAPVVLEPPGGRLDRAAARAELGLPEGEVAVGVMLNSAPNFDLATIRGAILDDLAARPGVTTVAIGAGPAAAPGARAIYPASRVTAAFDWMVAGAGYNTFHEALRDRIPTLFVPNEADEMDRQILRARHARSAGWGELLRAGDLLSVGRVVDRMLDAETRQGMRDRMGRLDLGDGAAEAAGLLVDLAAMMRLRDPL